MRLATLFATALLLVAAAATGAAAQGSTYNNNYAFSALQYCKTSYCPLSEISSWNCGPACQFHPGFRLKSTYTNASAQSQAFSGYDASSNTIVLAFRGTSNIRNWLSDLDFKKIPYPNAACSDCEVHKGFFFEWQSYASPALRDIAELHSQHGAQILITGHSLGAAVSLLAAMDVITHITNNVVVYNFGEPRVGTPVFAQWASSRIPARHQFRVTHKRDPVPHVPPMDFGFLHAPHELWYDNDGNTQWKNCDDTATREDPDCSDSIIPIGIEDHLLYLGVCTECTCDKETLIRKYGPKVALKVMSRMKQN